MFLYFLNVLSLDFHVYLVVFKIDFDMYELQPIFLKGLIASRHYCDIHVVIDRIVAHPQPQPGLCDIAVIHP